MIEKVRNGQKILLYSSIKEMPIRLHNLTQRYLLQDMGLGSDIQSIDEHFHMIDTYLKAGKVSEAMQERENQRFAFYSMIQGINYKAMAFASHIHSINDEVVTDRSDEGSRKLVESLEFTMDDVEETLSEVKKNFNMN